MNENPDRCWNCGAERDRPVGLVLPEPLSGKGDAVQSILLEQGLYRVICSIRYCSSVKITLSARETRGSLTVYEYKQQIYTGKDIYRTREVVKKLEAQETDQFILEVRSYGSPEWNIRFEYLSP